ncbi:FG-GAP-like repeat-containing protein [Fluviicola sp.]|uniref:Ig-like domain-containing protein n=1 Tax=Fluviicola sp. TaxID=1917219 RepID=UPI003D2CBE34
MKKLLYFLSFSMIVSSAWSQTPSGCFSSGNDVSFNKSFSNTRGITKGDFDNDGNLDIVVGNYGNGYLNRYSFVKGLGNGKFGTSISGGGGQLPGQVENSDLDGDGNLDLLLSHQTGITIYLGQGNGIFDSLTTYVLSFPKCLTLGDINEDGTKDVVFSIGTNLQALYGNIGAPETFTLSSTFNVSGALSDVRLADMNGDNHLDIISVGTSGVGISINNSGSLGTFATGIIYATGAGPFSLTVCDIDNDSDNDVINSNKTANTISVLKNSGSGVMGAATAYATGLGPENLVNYDINGDGFKDIAVVNGGSSTISIFFGSSTGTLTLNQTTQCPGTPRCIVAGNFNGDSKIDFVTGQLNAAYINSYVGNPSNNYVLPDIYALPGSPRSIHSNDFNGDGNKDLVFTNPLSNSFSISLGNGLGAFTLGASFTTGTNPTSIISGDLNNDGKIDVVTSDSTSNQVSVFYGNGAGSFSAATAYPAGTGPVSVRLGLLNADAFLDIVVANQSTNNVSTLLSSSGSSFGAPVSVSVGTNPIGIAIFDRDADGDQDIVSANKGSNNITRLTNDGLANFTSAGVTATAAGPVAIDAGDFDNDGDIDVVVLGTGGIGRLYNATGTLTNTSYSIPLPTPQNPQDIKLLDINNDNKMDVLCLYAEGAGYSGNVILLMGNNAVNSAFNFSTYAANIKKFSTEVLPRSFALGDFNNDTRFDLAVTNSTSKSINILLNTTPKITAGGPLTFCNGNSVTLTSTSALWYNWSPNSETTQAISATTSGTYYTTTSSSWSDWCSSSSNSLVVTVSAGPSAPTISNSGGSTICQGNTVTLTSSQATGNQWYKDGVLISGATNQTYLASTSGSYTVTYTNAGCTSPQSTAIVLTVSQTPVITAQGPTSFCTGGSVILHSTIGTNITWSPGGATTQDITVSTAGTYTATNNVGGCPALVSNSITVTISGSLATPTISPAGPVTLCPSGTVTLTSSSATNNIWSTGATTQSIVVNSAGSYFVHLDNGSCSSANSTAVSVSMASTPTTPTITAGGPTTFCTGGSVTLTASAGTTYLWSTGATTASINVTTAGSYTVQVTNASGCISAASAPTTVIVNTLPATPTITAGGPTTFCAGGSVTLTASAGTTYLWSPGGATTSSISVTTSGSYTVQVTNAAGCLSAASSPTVVTVNAVPATPTITAGGPTTFCAGGSVTLTASAGTTYLWSPGGATTSSISATTSGSYTVQVTNAAGCLSAASSPTVVTVNAVPATPTITAGGPTTFCAGGSVTLTASAGTTYLWSPGGATTASISATTSGSYTVQVTNAAGCLSAASSPTVVTVNATPATPTITAGGPTTFCAGGSVTLTASAGTTYLWSPGGATTSSISATTSGSYTVQVTNAAGCLSVASSPTVVTVNAVPATPTITAGGPTTFCAGGSVTLTASAGTTYLWSPGGATTASISATTSGSYTVQVTNAAGCLSPASAPTVVTVNAAPTTPTITAGGPTTFCSGGSVTLTASAGTTYLWSTGATTASISPTTSGSYSVQVTNAAGCLSAASTPTTVTVTTTPATPTITPGGATSICAGGSVTLTASAGTTYLWSTGATTASINVTTAGSYTVQVTNAGGCLSASSTATTVTVNPLPSAPTITAGGPTTFCAGGSVTLTSSAGTTYLWSTGATTASISPTTSGSYTVQVTNASGCLSPASAPTSVTVNTAPSAPTITAGGPTTFCAGGSVTLTASAGTTYLWSTGATTASILATTAGSYTVQVTNAAGCLSAASAPTTVTVNATPAAPTITAGGPTTFCAGGSVTLTSSAGTSYLWSTGATTASINVTTAGSYTVQVTTGGCTSPISSPTTITINAIPATPTITASGSTTFCAGGSVTLTSSAGTTYLWSTGATTASISPTTSGSYTVQVTNPAGCLSLTSSPTAVTVNALPAAPTITPSGSTSICASGSVTLTASPGVSYLWSTGATTASINVSTAGSYTVQITDANGCTSPMSAATNVTVNPIPSVPTITAGGSTTFCSGGSVILTSSASSNNLWSTGETTQSITVTTSGSYTVEQIVSGCTSGNSTATSVTVNPNPSVPTITAGGPTTFCAGGSVVLTSSAAAGNVWSTSATTQSITVTAAGSYSVNVTNGFGCTTSSASPITVIVNPIPSVPTITAGGPTTFCSGNNVVLTSSAASGNLWSTGETTQSITVTTSGSYTVEQILSGCSSGASASTNVTVNPTPATPTISAGGLTTFCLGGSVVLTSTAGTSYLWSTGETTQSITVTTSGSYSVQIVDGPCTSASSNVINVTANPIPGTPTITASGPLTFCSGNSVVLTSSFLLGNLWSTGETTQSITVTTTGSYTVEHVLLGCSSGPSASTDVLVNPTPATPTITAASSTTFCTGGSVVLTSTAGTSYLWSTGETTQSITVTTSGSYSVQIVDGPCTSATSNIINVTVNPIPSIPTVTAGGSTTFCSGGSVVLTSSASSGNLWSTGETTQSITVTTTGSYTVEQILSGCSSGASASTNVTVNPTPATPTITAGSVTTFCAGGSVVLTSTAGTSYLWSTGETTQSITVTTSGSYSVQIVDGPCTSASSNVINVTANPIPAVPTVTAGGSTTFCSGGSVVLTSSASSGNLWSTGETTQSITVTTAGSYTVEQILSGCSSGASASTNVTVNPTPATPTITAGGVTTFCAGGSVVLTSTAGTSYLWSTGETTQSITVTASGSYSVQIVGGSCNSAASNVINVTANPIPTAPTITAGGPTTFCAGGSVVLTSSVSSGNTWSTGATTQSITVSTSGIYTVNVTSLGCTSPNATQTITVNPVPAAPTITAGGPTTFCAGGSVVLTSSVSSGNTWSTTETTQSITVTASGSYTVTQTALGCTSSASVPVNVTVNTIPAVPTITTSGPTTFCAGGTVVLTSSSASNNFWSNGATTQSITVSSSGTFLVQVITNGCSSGTSAPKTVTVNSLPPAPTIVTGTTESICAGSSVTLTSSSTGGNLWSSGENTQSITVSAAGNFSVTVTDGNGCVSPASPITVVTVNPLPAAPVISPNGPTSFCSGGSVMLSSSYTSGNLWSSGSTANAITVSSNGTYSVTYTDGNGCVSSPSTPVTVTVNSIPAAPVITASGPTTFCAGGSVTLTSSYATGNSWSTLAMTPSITATASGVYSVIHIDGNGCASPSSTPVVVNVQSNPAPPSITAGGATTICQGSFVTLTSSYTSGNTWSSGGVSQSINATVSGNYTVTYTNVNGCTSTSSPMIVTVIPVSSIPNISASGSTTICDGSSVTLTSSDPNSTWSTGATTQSIIITTSGSYSVVGNQTGCPSQSSAPVVVNVNPAPATPIITPSGPTTICEGEELFLFTSGTGTNTWSTGYIGQVLQVTVSGNYWVSVQNVYGCSASSVVVPVIVNSNPIVTVNPFQPLCSFAAPFTMSNGLPAGGTYTGNGITSNIFDPGNAGIGSSIVTYTYVDVNDCSTSAQTTIDVNDCAGIDEKESTYFSLFPNPNNGQFKVISTGTPMDQIIIYDVQGKMVFNESYSGIFTLEFDLNAYSNGVYYIEINSDQEIHERMPLIINH